MCAPWCACSAALSPRVYSLHVRICPYSCFLQVDIEGSTEEAVAKTKRFAASLFLEFVFSGEVAVSGKLFRAYSCLRSELQGVFIVAHEKIEVQNVAESPLALAESLLELVTARANVAVSGEDDEDQTMQRIASAIAGDEVAGMAAFVKNVLPQPMKMHDPLLHVLRGFMAEATDHARTDADNFAAILQCIFSHICEALPEKWVAFAADVAEL
eukprot:1920572-Alexandrium_andersonii.AAC.1